MPVASHTPSNRFEWHFVIRSYNGTKPSSNGTNCRQSTFNVQHPYTHSTSYGHLRKKHIRTKRTRLHTSHVTHSHTAPHYLSVKRYKTPHHTTHHPRALTG